MAVPTDHEYAVLVVRMTPELEDMGFLEDLEAYMPVEAVFDINVVPTKPLLLTKGEKKLVKDSVHTALQQSQTRLRLTHPSNPVWDAYAVSEATLRALWGRLRRA